MRSDLQTPNADALARIAKRLPKPCAHPPHRLYSWHAYDGTLCVCCCECGRVLSGAA